MGSRRKDTRPRLALWMLVALGDIVLLMVSVGLSVLVASLAVVAVTAAGIGAWRFTRRTAVNREAAVPVVGRQQA
ncbi:hypothetical protein [Micromonospora halophytica]|uniref:Uncharacterized protein n=1 Tax=Micromonospora halophytica TaxID=47864 RepID=A0A1C5H703_9ACTN|nr:hypothetical protein [Micromonospora halophytica]SCG41806.1 hypothetical protein GA0070560_103203 [Micromonospora halophytica]